MTYGSGNTRVILEIIWVTVGSSSISGITIGGTALTHVSSTANNNSGNPSTDIWQSSAPLAGSSGDVQVTYNTAGPSFGQSVALYDLVTTTPTAFAGSTLASGSPSTSFGPTISVPSGGGGLLVTSTGGANTISFTNASQDALRTPSGQKFYFAHTTATGSPVTVTETLGASDNAYASLASWGP
jgi:hypothetical protein